MEADKLNKLAEIAGKDAIRHGFGNSGTPYRLQVKAACEIAECIEAYRNDRIADIQKYEAALSFIEGRHYSPEEKRAHATTQYIQWCKDTVQDEMADVAILLLGLTYHYNIPIKNDRIEEARTFIDYTYGHDFVEEAGRIMRVINNPSLDHFESALVMIERWMKAVVGQDLIYWIEKKIEYNKQRPYLHGNMNDKTL